MFGKNKYIKQGRDEMLSEVIEKFESMWDEYFAQGDLTSADFVTDLVAYLQDDTEAMSKDDKGI
jgi:hypothetical protein